MKQYQIVKDKLQYTESSEIPKKNSDERLIKVQAIGLNRADLLQIQGKYHNSYSDVPGLEIAGIDVDTNERVCALIPGGGFSEYISVKEEHTFRIPQKLDFITAAALPEALSTIWLALFCKAELNSKDKVLIHGGSSGIGTFAIQIARAIGCQTIYTTGSNEKSEETCLKLGATRWLNYKEQDFGKIIKEQGGVDKILDILGGNYFNQNLQAASKNACIIILAVMNGSIGEVKLSSILLKNLSIKGVTLRSQNENTKADIIKGVSNNLLPLLTSGKVKPMIDSVFSFKDLPKALARLQDRKHLGKIIAKL